MSDQSEYVLGLDIGGANVKAADSRGRAWSVPFELWRNPEHLTEVLRTAVNVDDLVDQVALTLTGESCDCFETKDDGVRSIVESVRTCWPNRLIRVWGLDGRFHAVDEVIGAPKLAASANWLATATVAAARFAQVGLALLVDIGSTTSDIIPLRQGRAVPRGLTDTERLRTGELVYVGARRTPLCALATELPFRGSMIGLAAEWFATTLDLSLILGEIADDALDLSTADGRPATVEYARGRLARMIGADRLSFTESDAVELAEAAVSSIVDRLELAARRVVDVLGESPHRFIISGSGSFLAKRLVARLDLKNLEVVSLAERWGFENSSAACARALVFLAQEHDD